MPDKSLRELQREINDWQRETFGELDDPDEHLDAVYEKLNDEIEEFCEATSNLAEELADIVIVAMDGARSYSIDLAEAIEAKMKVNRARTWAKQPDGTFQHENTKESPHE